MPSQPTLALALVCLAVLTSATAVDESDGASQDVGAAREAALAALDKPLEKMRVGELMALMEERGVPCKDCQGAEKSVVVAQARDCIHLPKIDKKSTEAPGGAKASKGGSRTGPAQAQAKPDATAEEEPASNTESSEEMPEEAIAAAREAALEKLGKPLEKMKIKELLALLTERGVECKNCRGAEKSHIIGQVRDAIHLPKNTKKAEDKKRNAAKARSGREGGKDEGVEDILAKMKGMPGMENIKVFGRDDIDKMMKDGNWGGTRDDL